MSVFMSLSSQAERNFLHNLAIEGRDRSVTVMIQLDMMKITALTWFASEMEREK